MVVFLLSCCLPLTPLGAISLIETAQQKEKKKRKEKKSVKPELALAGEWLLLSGLNVSIILLRICERTGGAAAHIQIDPEVHSPFSQ